MGSFWLFKSGAVKNDKKHGSLCDSRTQTMFHDKQFRVLEPRKKLMSRLIQFLECGHIKD